MLTSITCPSCEASYRVPADRLGAGRKVRCQRCRDEWYATPDHETAPVDAPEAAAEAEIETEAPAVVAQPLEAPVVVVTAPEPILSLEEASEIEVIERPERIDGAAPKPARGAPRGVGGYLARRRRTSAAGGRPRAAATPRRPRLSAVAVAIGVVALGALAGARVEIVRLAPSLASLYEAFGLQVNVRGLAIRDVRSAEELVDGSPVLLVTGLVENVSAGELDVPRLRLAVTAGGERELYAWTTVAARPKLQPGETATFRARLASPPAEGQAIAVRFLARHDLMASLGH